MPPDTITYAWASRFRATVKSRSPDRSRGTPSSSPEHRRFPDQAVGLGQEVELSVVVLGKPHVDAARSGNRTHAGQRRRLPAALAVRLFQAPAQDRVNLVNRCDGLRLAVIGSAA